MAPLSTWGQAMAKAKKEGYKDSHELNKAAKRHYKQLLKKGSANAKAKAKQTAKVLKKPSSKK